MTVSNGGANGLMSAEDATINGPGKIFLSTTPGDNHIDNGAATGQTLTLNAQLTGDTGFEGSNGTCSANGNVGWLPYASLGLDVPVRGERLRYGVHRGTASTDLVVPVRESADQP